MAVMRIAALALLLLLGAPAVAGAGWGPPERVTDFFPPGEDVAVVAPVQGTAPLTVRVRGRADMAVPGSENASFPVAALGEGGLVVVAWTVSRICGGDDGSKAIPCERRVLASTWRLGESPAPGRVVSRSSDYADAPLVAAGPDGTVVVSWNVLTDGFFGDPAAVDAAVAVGTGPFVASRILTGEATLAGLKVVRGAPEIAVGTRSGGGTTMVLVRARGGRLGRPRTEARVRGDHLYDLGLLRTSRGDRVLLWQNERSDRVYVRTGAPGRRLARARLSFKTPAYQVALGEGGDFAFLLRGAKRRSVQPIRAVRGRTGSARLVREVLRPPAHDFNQTILSADVAVDPVGRVFAVWDRRLRPAGPGRPRYAVAGAVARRGRRFGRGKVLSSLGRTGVCTGADVVATAVGRAVARWTCDPAGDAPEFSELARYRPRG